jgi:hypothetical protein
MAAFVRVSGPPNSNFLVGYPGISATLVSMAPDGGRASEILEIMQLLVEPGC